MNDNNNMIANDLFDRYYRLTIDDVVQSSWWFSSVGHTNACFQEDLDWSLAYFEKNTNPSLYTRVCGDILIYNKKSHGGPLLFKLISNKTSTAKEANQKAVITIIKTYQIKPVVRERLSLMW